MKKIKLHSKLYNKIYTVGDEYLFKCKMCYGGAHLFMWVRVELYFWVDDRRYSSGGYYKKSDWGIFDMSIYNFIVQRDHNFEFCINTFNLFV